MAAGSMAYLDEGAWTKRLHPGWACHAGIMAARLAAAGFAGPAAILESRYGFLHAYSSQGDIEQLERAAHGDYAIMSVSIKPYACCRYMHGPIDCLLEITRTHRIETAQISRVRCGVLTGGRGLVADPIEKKRQASNVVEAQFSMPFGAAIAILAGQAGLAVFSKEWLHNPAVRELMRKVECYSAVDLDAYYPAEWRASASVHMQDGHEFHASVRYPLGDPHNPLSWEQLEMRFHELVTPVITDPGKRREMIDRVRRLDEAERVQFRTILRRSKTLSEQNKQIVEERLHMYDSLLDEDPEIQERVAKAELRGQQKAVIDIIEMRFPALIEEAQEIVARLNKADQLSQLMKQMVMAPDEANASWALKTFAA